MTRRTFVYATVSGGRLTVTEGHEQEHTLVDVSLVEQSEKTVVFLLAEAFKKHALTGLSFSSSLDFPTEYGVPEGVDPHDLIEKAFKEALTLDVGRAVFYCGNTPGHITAIDEHGVHLQLEKGTAVVASEAVSRLLRPRAA